MYKTIGKIASLIILLVLSFVYTDKVFSSVKESDPIMKEVISYKNKNDVAAVEPIINGDELMLGYSGISVNKNESYKRMKNIDKFNEEEIIYDRKIPKTTISKTYDYYIKRGNPKNKNVAIIFKVNDSKNITKLLNTLSKNNITINFFVDGVWLEKNIDYAFDMVSVGSLIYNLGYDGVYDKKNINIINKLIESISLEDSLYCLNENKDDKEKEICTKKKMHSIIPTLIEPTLTDLKKNLDEGIIISYDLKNFDENKFLLIVNSVTSKGYNITGLNKVLME